MFPQVSFFAMATEKHLPTENDFDVWGMEIAGHCKSVSFRIQHDNFAAFFGVERCIVVSVWKLLLEHIPAVQPKLQRIQTQNTCSGHCSFHSATRRQLEMQPLAESVSKRFANGLGSMQKRLPVLTATSQVNFCLLLIHCFSSLTPARFVDRTGSQDTKVTNVLLLLVAQHTRFTI
mgnify:CR=1 FL=1